MYEKELIDKWVAEYKEGATIRSIGIKYGVNPCSVNFIFRRLNIEIRPHQYPVRDLFQHFLDNVTASKNDCIIWVGSVDKQGYGKIYSRNAAIRAHRYSYSVFVEDPFDLMVCHKCDNPPCVNPDHLFLGTSADNSKDHTPNASMIYLPT